MSTSRLRTSALSRRSFIQLGGLAGGAVLLGYTAACAGPTGKPSSDTLVLALNRSLVSLDNKLNQFDAAVTAQRGVRQALTRIGNDLKPQLVLADASNQPRTPNGLSDCVRASAIPTAARSRSTTYESRWRCISR